MITTRKRLDPSVFDLPIEKMRAGYYTDAYFNHTRGTLLRDGRRPNVVMQVFQKQHSYLGGMDEVYEGHDGVRRFWRQWLASWERVEFEQQRYVDAGDKVVSLTLKQRGQVLQGERH